MHKGTDFAAPTGTPIMVGSGTVTRQDGVEEEEIVLR